ncbi:MAG TPA: hypothetical protein PKO27_17015 [Deltaproteobacteria bacterium]|nr:hypothetical protein [Deltaproteobacteria bacterium]
MNFASSVKVLLLFTILSGLAYVPAMAQNPTDAAGALGNQAIGKYGSKEGLNANLFNPLMSASTPLSTLDGSQQGAAQLSCPSSQRFMEIFIQPGPSGDITTLMVNQDTDFDGVLDYSYLAPFAVSGVCANGVIACDSGTWTNCTPYVWTSYADGRVNLQPAADSDMKQCFCVNTSCGSGLVLRNIAIVLKSIGGGVVAAIHHNSSRYVISDVKIDGTYAQYFGQDSTGCLAAVGGANVEQYFYNPNALQGAVDAEAASQAGDPGSYYTMLTGVASVQSPMSLRQCRITRVASMTVDPSGYCHMLENVDDRCQAIASDPECSSFPREEVVDGVTTINNFVVTGLAPSLSCRDFTTTLQASCNYVCPGDGGWQIPCLNNPVCTVGGRMAVCSGGVCPLDAAVTCSSAPTCIANGEARLCQVQYSIQEATGGWSNGINVVASGNMLRFYSSTASFVCVENPALPCMDWGGWGYYCDLGDGRYGTCEYQYGTTETGHVTFAPGTTLTALVEGPNYLCGWAFGGGNVFGLDRGYYGAKVTFTIAGATVTGLSADPFAGLYRSSVSTNGSSLWISGIGLNRPGGEHWGSGSVRFDFSPNHCPLPYGTPCGGTPAACYQTCQNTTCRDWWVKERTYVCKTGSYDFSDARRRVQSIRDSVQDQQTAFYYRDYRKTETGWQYEDSTYDMSGAYRPIVGACETACKTRRLVDDTKTTIATKKDDFVTPSTYQFFYKKCTEAGCPVGPSEDIVRDCQCMNEFAEAAVIMQSLRQAGRDIICTSGQRGP